MDAAEVRARFAAIVDDERLGEEFVAAATRSPRGGLHPGHGKGLTPSEMGLVLRNDGNGQQVWVRPEGHPRGPSRVPKTGRRGT